MEQHLNAERVHNTELGFNTTRMMFTFGNIAAIAVNVFADLDSSAKIALSTFVVLLNLSSLLSFDTELKQFQAISKDGSSENSNYTNVGASSPWAGFRIFCVLICVIASVTQLMAINA
jgi:hypothetical protein